MRSLRALLPALALVTTAAPASAGGVSCIISTTPLNFGRYVPSRNPPADFTATLTLNCSATGLETARIEGSIGLLGSARDRALSDGPHRLRYQLFSDPARSIPWTDGAGAKAVSGLVGPSTPLRASFTVYGRILARQRQAQVGNYSDQITAVLNY